MEGCIMATKKAKGLVINIAPDEILGWEIMQSGDYKYASIRVKRSDDEYLRVSYEWKGDTVPDMVMALMSFMQANKIEKNADSAEYVELKKRM